ncbi:MAG: ABC transporter ATP-binding protein [Simkaniaceae bacterium]|nr:ABC transporter ATP-binding protein [Simkaniaceae bacterium]
MKQPLLTVKNLKKSFPVDGKKIQAVDDISFSIDPGETLGLVGESGCGKSTVGKLLLRLFHPSSGSIVFDNQNVINLSRKELTVYRQNAQIIFQDPFSSLNPRMTLGEIIKEPLVIHGILNPHNNRKDSLYRLLNLVGLDEAFINRYPHELSGGQRQRIGIARALSLNPQFIVCDEPIAALDVSIQAQIINLLKNLQNDFGLTYLFISHDLAMVRHLCTRIAVMYLGQIVEIASRDQIYCEPHHPYTKGLLSAIPIPDPVLERKRTKVFIKGEVPSPFRKPNGCIFCNRCPKAMDICHKTPPKQTQVAPNHFVTCHLY